MFMLKTSRLPVESVGRGRRSWQRRLRYELAERGGGRHSCGARARARAEARCVRRAHGRREAQGRREAPAVGGAAARAQAVGPDAQGPQDAAQGLGPDDGQGDVCPSTRGAACCGCSACAFMHCRVCVERGTPPCANSTRNAFKEGCRRFRAQAVREHALYYHTSDLAQPGIAASLSKADTDQQAKTTRPCRPAPSPRPSVHDSPSPLRGPPGQETFISQR